MLATPHNRHGHAPNDAAVVLLLILLTGLTGDICVLLTANNVYMRDFHLEVLADCVASQDADAPRARAV